ncbi:glycosyltransferase [Antarcticimicrobium luteum]|nr:glycosyltransferase [Antarcticimicrobium luteum]
MSDPGRPSTPPRLAIVIPLFKHSGLVWEALASALDQNGENRYGIVLVNDGCPFASSHRAGLAAAAAAPVPFRYIRQTNQGLSGARNTGIDVALATWPDLEGIYFLDADNRLSRRSVRNMLDALDAHPEADWFYPDIKMIGLNNMCSMQGRYNTALHAELNICEAGSLVRRRVFDAGVRYDEAMKHGYEDWDFWFSAIDAGFVTGQYLPGIDFRYRQRPESMLRESIRSDQKIRAYMLSKHRWLDRPRDLTRNRDDDPEAKFALITPEGACYLNEARTDFETFPLDRLKEDFYRWREKQGAYGFPGKILFSSRPALSALETEGLLPWAVWDLEQRLETGAKAASLRLEQNREIGLSFDAEQIAAKGSAQMPPDLTMISAKVLSKISRDKGSQWFSSICTAAPKPKHSLRTIRIGSGRDETFGDSTLLAASVGLKIFDDNYNSGEARFWVPQTNGPKNRKGRVRSFDPEREDSVQIARPVQNAGRTQIAFVVPIADFGGVERVAYQIANTLPGTLYDCHLVCLGSGNMHIPDEFRSAFRTISWYHSDALTKFARGPYLGTFLAAELGRKEARIAASLFEGIDVAINCHSSDFYNLAGDLKRAGVLCLDHQHILELTSEGQPVGYPLQSLAFEHACEAILTCSQQLADWFHRNGIPSEKLVKVRNGPGILTRTADLDQVAERVAARNPADEAERPLRALFLGRLEYQKGMDRLIRLIDRTQGDWVEWRIIGKAIVTGKEHVYPSASGIEVEPPLYNSAQVRATLAWADVLIHPSRYEGLPLAIIDAMSNGVPVIATDVGAIEEVVLHDRNGFLLAEDSYVEQAEALLKTLAGDRARVIDMAAAAVAHARNLQWDRNITALEDLITRLRAPRRVPA